MMLMMKQTLYLLSSGLCHDDVSDEMMMMKTSSCFSSCSSPEKSDRAVVAVMPLLLCCWCLMPYALQRVLIEDFDLSQNFQGLVNMIIFNMIIVTAKELRTFL